MVFACIFVPDFAVAAVLRAEPELRGRALAVFEGRPPLEKIYAVNELASGLGVGPDMTKTQAELGPELTLRPRSQVREAGAHAALIDCAQAFSPCVEDTAADAAVLDLAGLESLFGAPAEIAHKILNCAAKLGLEVNVGVAANPDAATLAGRGFSGVTMIPSGKEGERLGSLPVDVLFSANQADEKESARLLGTLDRWGVRNLRALAALPEVALSERLGQEGLRLRQLARGAASRTLVPVEAAAVFEEAVELEYPIVLLEPLAFVLNRLLEQICSRLAARALNTQELRLTLELASAHPVSSTQIFRRTISLPLPMLEAKLFLKLMQLDLNAHPPGAPIVKVHLAAEPARPRPGQGGLFRPPTPEPEKLELTLARIASLVGEGRVGWVELLDTHRVEAFRMRRAMPDVAKESKAQKKPVGAQEKPAVAALRIFRPPLPVNITLENGEPVRLLCSKKKELQGDVLWKAGPWRSSGDWWEREAWSRDEWDIALQNAEGAALYRLVHDLLSGRWFVEGTYD